MATPDKYKFIILLGKALHIYGVPSYKIQNYLTEIALQKGIKGNFMDSPTWINYVFYSDDDEETYNYVECVPPGEINLGALSEAEEITKKVLKNEMTFDEAKKALENVHKKTKIKSDWVLLLAFAVSGGAFCLLMETNWISSLMATLMGGVVYGVTVLARKSRYISSTLESLASFIVTLFICLITPFISNINVSLTILSAIIVFIPGLSMTTALEEITSRSLVSGTAKLFDAFISLFKQFFGVILALAVLPLISNIDIKPAINDLPQWATYLGIPLLSVSLLPVFQVRKKDIIYCLLTCLFCYLTTVFLAPSGILLSTFVGTLVVVFSSRLFKKITKTPEHVYQTVGIIILVPGSKAFIGISTIFMNAPLENTSSMGHQVGYILMGVIGGLIFAGSFKEIKK